MQTGIIDRGRKITYYGHQRTEHRSVEPMNGLDKGGIKDMRQFLDMKTKSETMLKTLYSADDIDTLCDTVCEMDKEALTVANDRKYFTPDDEYPKPY